MVSDLQLKVWLAYHVAISKDTKGESLLTFSSRWAFS